MLVIMIVNRTLPLPKVLKPPLASSLQATSRFTVVSAVLAFTAALAFTADPRLSPVVIKVLAAASRVPLVVTLVSKAAIPAINPVILVSLAVPNKPRTKNVCQ